MKVILTQPAHEAFACSPETMPLVLSTHTRQFAFSLTHSRPKHCLVCLQNKCITVRIHHSLRGRGALLLVLVGDFKCTWQLQNKVFLQYFGFQNQKCSDSKGKLGKQILKGERHFLKIRENWSAGEPATVDSPRGGERGRQRPTPSSAQTSIVVPVPCDLPPRCGRSSWPHCEDGPVCWPGPGPRQVGRAAPQPPRYLQQEQPHLWPRGPTSTNPEAVHLAAKPTACGCQVWFCGQSEVWNGFSVSFYTKGTNCCIHPLY
ncbi:hypothetical protein HJG60_007997 [Phyllostomus discolor]|uniref:Uncharacterized protein n=1 Tax=Phyllostomus discolor TaxID=89673 RepID=A0A834EVE6_9CHIR|nr:hypothetical protein HJG60_007997 [Phyllostomus discolor]